MFLDIDEYREEAAMTIEQYLEQQELIDEIRLLETNRMFDRIDELVTNCYQLNEEEF